MNQLKLWSVLEVLRQRGGGCHGVYVLEGPYYSCYCRTVRKFKNVRRAKIWAQQRALFVFDRGTASCGS